MKKYQIFDILILIILIVSTNSLERMTNIHEVNNQCTNNNNCNYLNICNNKLNKCEHKPFFPPSLQEMFGALSILIGSALSNAGGIGGGGLLIPILILVLKFSTHEAIPISKLMIFTGALTAFIMGLKNKHPFRQGIPIDLNIAGILIPMLLFGTMVGVSLNKVMPPSVILISLTLVLIVNTYKTITKAISLYKKENKEMKSKEFDCENEEKVKLKDNALNDSKGKEDSEPFHSLKNFSNSTLDQSIDIEQSTQLKIDLEKNRDEVLQREYEKDKHNFPMRKVLFMIASYICLLLISLLKGSTHFKSLISIKSCSPAYWMIYFLYLPIVIFITFYYSKMVLKEYDYRKSINYPYHPNEIIWTKEIAIKYPFYSFFGGVMAGLLGIGGGLILGPLLLELGLNPIISTATSNFLVLFTSSSTSLQFVLLGMMNLNYGLICTICSTVGSYIGTVAIQKLLDKTGRSSILIFTLGIVLAFSTIFIPIHAFAKIENDYYAGKKIWNFSSPC